MPSTYKGILARAPETGKPYLDENYDCHFFETEEMMNAYAEEHKITLLGEVAKEYTAKELMTSCHAGGAVHIIRHGTRNKLTELFVDSKQVAQQYYNPALARVYARLKQTRKKKYLYELTNCRCIVAAKVIEHNQIRYCTLKIPNSDEYLYLSFTDLVEFDAWSEKNPGWEPLEADIVAMHNISKGHGFLFNPYGSRLVISANKLSEVPIIEKISKPADQQKSASSGD